MNEIIHLYKFNEGEGIFVLEMLDESSKNRYTDTFTDALIDKLKLIEKNKEIKVLLLKGLPDVFCAGADKSSLMKLSDSDVNVKDLVLSEMVIGLPIPVIAVMEGAALGGGFVLALCCDIILMNERAMYGTNFTDMGFTPGMGCTRLLQGLVGDYVANEMMFGGRLYKGKTFRERGFVNYILPKSELMPKAISIALDIDEKPRKTIEILKYSLTIRKRQLLMEARVNEDFMHKISFANPEVLDIIKERYRD